MSNESASKAVEFAKMPATASTRKRAALITSTRTRIFLCSARRLASSFVFAAQQSSMQAIYQLKKAGAKLRAMGGTGRGAAIPP